MAQSLLRASCWLLVLLLASPVVAADAAPTIVIPAPGSGFKPWRARLYEFNHATMTEIYVKRHRGQQPWAAEVEQVLDAWAKRFSLYPGYASTDLALNGPGRLIAKGCDDPMILYCHGVTVFDQGRYADALKFFRDAWNGFKTRPYTARRTASTTQRIALCHAELDGDNASKEWNDMVDLRANTNVQMLCDQYSHDPIGKQLCEEMIHETVDTYTPGFESMRTVVLALLDQQPTLDPWLAHMARGQCEMSLAWEARGHDVSDNVTEQGWKGFHEHLAAAEKQFAAAWATDPTLPMAAAEELLVAMAGSLGRDVECQWFNRAVALQCDFPNAYENLLGCRQPRWGGTYREMLEVGATALATGDFTTDVPGFFLTAVDSTVSDMVSMKADPEPLWADPTLWKAVQVVCAGYLKQPLRVDSLGWDLSRYAGYAWRCGKHDKALNLLREAGDQADGVVFKQKAGIAMDAVLNSVTP